MGQAENSIGFWVRESFSAHALGNKYFDVRINFILNINVLDPMGKENGEAAVHKPTWSASQGASLDVHKFNVVWLSYDRGRPRPAKELVNCAGWGDVNELFEAGCVVV